MPGQTLMDPYDVIVFAGSTIAFSDRLCTETINFSKVVQRLFNQNSFASLNRQSFNWQV